MSLSWGAALLAVLDPKQLWSVVQLPADREQQPSFRAAESTLAAADWQQSPWEAAADSLVRKPRAAHTSLLLCWRLHQEQPCMCMPCDAAPPACHLY